MRQLCGEGSYASIPLSDFGKDFMLEPLLRASSIIVDENDVGTFIDKAANLKAVITGDTLSINRKFKTPVAFNFRGFMVQCLNEMPRIKDRSDSFFRRQLFVPFTKCFTGAERKYIKNDYLHRKEVLEYVLHKVLHSDFYELSEPEACKLALEEYKDFVDPVRSFLTEFMPRFKWDLLPTDFLYDLYKSWYKETAGNERSMKGKSMFVKEVKQMIQTYYHDWEVCLTPSHPSGRMDASEPLIFEYNLDKWKNPVYHGTDIEKMCHPILNSTYRAIRRVVPNAGSNDDEE
jgi:putative DNA primase/helicase